MTTGQARVVMLLMGGGQGDRVDLIIMLIKCNRIVSKSHHALSSVLLMICNHYIQISSLPFWLSLEDKTGLAWALKFVTMTTVDYSLSHYITRNWSSLTHRSEPILEERRFTHSPTHAPNLSWKSPLGRCHGISTTSSKFNEIWNIGWWNFITYGLVLWTWENVIAAKSTQEWKKL